MGNTNDSKGNVWLWTLVGSIAGFLFGSLIMGVLGGAVCFFIIGFLAYRSSKNNNGGPPAWLWRSSKK